MKIFQWSIRDGFLGLLLWAAGFCGVIVLVILLFPSLETIIEAYTQDVSLIVAMMGKEMQFLENRSLFDVWMTLELFTWWGLFLSAYIVIFASSAISGEVDSRTMELLLAQPVSREKVLLSKFAALMVNLTLICAASFAVIWIMTNVWIEEEASFGIYGWIFFNNGMMLFAVAGFVFLISVLANEPKVVIGITMGTLLFSFLINITVTTARKWIFLGMITPYYYCDASQIFFRGGVDWKNILILFAAGLALLTAALVVFRHKDIQ